MASEELGLALPTAATADKPVQDDVHDRLEFYFNTLSLPWTAPLCFPMHVGPLCATKNHTNEVDICRFISGEAPECYLSDFTYFDRSIYPYNEKPRVSTDLHRAILQAATRSGFQIAGKGSSWRSA